MEKMLVVIFDSETKAYEGSHALAELDKEGSISIHAETVIQKNNDGTVTVKRTESGFPIRTISGTAIGSLIGLLGGPAGVIMGAALGTTSGLIGDLYVANFDEEFLGDASAALKPGKFAVVADVSEEWITPVDTRMEAIGGVVFRTPRQYFEEERRAKDIAALREELDRARAEQARVQDERKAKMQAKIDELNRKLQRQVDQGKQRSEQLKSETEAKLDALQKKAATAHGETKAAINGRITEIRKKTEHAAATLRSATAKQLRKAADKLQKAG
jgi:uncharacterized membrane protein